LEVFDLSPFLNNGFIYEYFKRSGKIPCDSDLLKMWARGELINGELILNTLVDISSYPYGYFKLRDLIISSTSLVYRDLSLIFGLEFVKVCSRY
jgi:hypothetical protein